MVTGDPGTGKSIVLRLLEERLRALPDVVVGTIEHPQSRTSDFYRELGDLFGVPLAIHNRWGGFKALRIRWSEHIASTLTRPVLIIDEAQEALTPVLSELRILASKDFDSRQLLCVVLAGDARLPERLRTRRAPAPRLPHPPPPRPRLRLARRAARLPRAPASTPRAIPSLMTTELKATLADHAAGNYRVLMNLADELLTVAADRDLPRLDEKLFLDVFGQPSKPKASAKKR